MAKNNLISPKRTRADPAHRPEVIVDIIFDQGMFFISVENIGDKPALRVSTHFEQKIMGMGGSQDITELPMFHNIEFLAPHKAIVTVLDSSTAYFQRGEPTRVTVSISYWDAAHHHYRATIRHDLGIYKDISYLSRE
jgi:hypothetical protein